MGKSGLLSKKLGKEAQAFDLTQLQGEDLRRKLKLMKNLGTSALPDGKLVRFNQLVSDMGSTYSKAKGTKRGGSELWSLEPELTEVMANSRDPDELQYYWEQWREKSGKMIKGNYHEYIDLYNEAAKLNGFPDASMMKVDPYESKTFIQENMNCHWWKLRNQIQGLEPPRKRSKDHFDPGAKYHVAGDVGYVRYFTAFIYEFQFYRAMCLQSGRYVPGDPKKPLHRCNFYGSV